MQKYLVVFKSGAKVLIQVEELNKSNDPLLALYPFLKDGKEDRSIIFLKDSVAAFIPESYLAENQK